MKGERVTLLGKMRNEKIRSNLEQAGGCGIKTGVERHRTIEEIEVWEECPKFTKENIECAINVVANNGIVRWLHVYYILYVHTTSASCCTWVKTTTGASCCTWVKTTTGASRVLVLVDEQRNTNTVAHCQKHVMCTTLVSVISGY